MSSNSSSSSQAGENHIGSQSAGIGPVASAVTHEGYDGYEFAKNLQQKVSDEGLKIVREELDEFMQRSRDRLNLIRPGKGVDELSKEIRSLVAFHFGYPCARVMTSTTRATNDWNTFIHENFVDAKAELGTCLGFIYLLLISPVSTSPQGVQMSRSMVIGLLAKRWHEREKDGLGTTEDESMTTTRSTTPTSRTPKLVGDLIIPSEREKWNKERTRMWDTIKKSVRISSSSHTY
jgi:hypothetical protein